MKFLSAPCHAERGIQNILAKLKIIGTGDRLEWGDPKRSPRYGDEGGSLAQGVAVWWMYGEVLHGPRWVWKEETARENFGRMPNEKALPPGWVATWINQEKICEHMPPLLGTGVDLLNGKRRPRRDVVVGEGVFSHLSTR